MKKRRTAGRIKMASQNVLVVFCLMSVRFDPDETAPAGAVSSGSSLFIVIGSFNNNPENVNVHENYVTVFDLWTIDADCDVQYTSTCYRPCASENDCNNNNINGAQWPQCDGGDHSLYTCSYTCYPSTMVDCDVCEITPAMTHFEMNGFTVRKKECSDPTCGPLCSSPGCVNDGEVYTIPVSCYRTGYYTDGRIFDSFTVTITPNEAPTFTFSGNEIKIRSSLAMEFSYTYTMVLTVMDRRKDATTGTLSISLHGCYQTPTCANMSITVNDTLGYRNESEPTNTLAIMNYPPPSGHFVNFSSSWQNLIWSHVWIGDSLDNVEQNQLTGDLYLTGSIFIHPVYMYKSYDLRVTVDNSDSCFTTTCEIKIMVINTDRNNTLLGSTSVHEDTDTEKLLHCIQTRASETCVIESISPTESNLFEMRIDYDQRLLMDSWCLYKRACEFPGCGYKKSIYGPFLCPMDTGCLNHAVTRKYDVTLECSDDNNSMTDGIFSVNIMGNKKPIYLTLPDSITVIKSSSPIYEDIYTVKYFDQESEELSFELEYYPSSYNGYVGLEVGENNSAEILLSTTTRNWSLPSDNLFVHVCGHERRNEICSILSIRFEDAGTHRDIPDKDENEDTYPWVVGAIGSSIVVALVVTLLCLFVVRRRRHTTNDGANMSTVNSKSGSTNDAVCLQDIGYMDGRINYNGAIVSQHDYLDDDTDDTHHYEEAVQREVGRDSVVRENVSYVNGNDTVSLQNIGHSDRRSNDNDTIVFQQHLGKMSQNDDADDTLHYEEPVRSVRGRDTCREIRENSNDIIVSRHYEKINQNDTDDTHQYEEPVWKGTGRESAAGDNDSYVNS